MKPSIFFQNGGWQCHGGGARVCGYRSPWIAWRTWKYALWLKESRQGLATRRQLVQELRHP